MYKTEFIISKMDCPSEENLIRMKLDGLPEIKTLDFDIENRKLLVFHTGENPEIEKRLMELNLGSEQKETTTVDPDDFTESSSIQSKLLWTVLVINFGFFIIEMTTGLISRSMGLVADSLDMLADSMVYGLSLWAVGSTTLRKKKVAKLSGYFQITLALIGLLEVLRRFIGVEEMPDFRIMIIVSPVGCASLAVLRRPLPGRVKLSRREMPNFRRNKVRTNPLGHVAQSGIRFHDTV